MMRSADDAGVSAKLFDDHLKIPPFPARGILPEESENDLIAWAESLAGQIDMLQLPSAVFGIIVVHGLPVVKTPMPSGCIHQQDPQLLALRKRARLVVVAPVEVLRGCLVLQIPFDSLRWLIEELSVKQRPAQFYVLGVSPKEWARRACTFPVEQFSLRKVRGVPDLFGNQTAGSGCAFHHA